MAGFVRRVTWGLAICGITASLLPAATIFTFSGLQDREQVLDFYAGGAGSLGSRYADYGVRFLSGAFVAIDSDVGGSGNFANAPSPFGVVYSSTGLVSFNVAAGFLEALSFYYVTYGGGPSGSVGIFGEANGGGAQLGSATLLAPNRICPGDPQGGFNGCWTSVTIPFTGTAKSVVFQVPAFSFALDNIGLTLPRFETSNLVGTPESGSWVLVGPVGAWLWARKRWRRS